MEVLDMKKQEKIGFVLNPLLEAQRKFSVIENRLFYLGLQDINPHITEKDIFYDEKFPDTHITPSELQKIFGYDACLTEISKVCDNFSGTTIKIWFEDGFDIYTVFQHMKYRKGKGLFIRFNEDMRDFLLDIYKSYKEYGFTKLEMQQIFYLNSSYAMRLLELILKFRSTAKNGIIEREISIEDLREKLNVPENAYKGKIGNFKSRVLDLPIQDINQNTQYFISYKTIKKGRSVGGFRFTCNCNNVPNDDEYNQTIDTSQTRERKDSPTIAEVEKTEDKIEKKLLNKMIGYGFSLKVINTLMNSCGGIDELARRLEYAEKRAKEDTEKGKEIKSISGYLRIAIEYNWAEKEKAKEKVQKKELDSIINNEEWELWAKKNFANEQTTEAKEILFDTNNDSDKMMITVIKNSIKEKRLNITSKRLLAEHGLTVTRFMELYN